ncbi:MAG: diguanylate cyclase [Nitrosomonadales bacterium]
MFDKLKYMLFGSLRRQLIVGMSLVIASVMILFVWTLTRQQQASEIEHHSEQVTALAESVATSSAVWVASRDFSGLQEIVQGISRYPNLRYVIVLDLRGQVLAHNDPGKIGQYLTDMPQQQALVLHRTRSMIEVINPIALADKRIGWVRIGIDMSYFNDELAKTRQQGLVFALLGIVFSILTGVLAGRYLTRRLFVIQQVADDIKAGQSDARVVLSGDDEAAKLARQFNDMLDSMAEQAAQIRSFYEFDIVGLAITSPVKGWIKVNQCLCNMLEYSELELRSMTWAELTHPDDMAADLEQFNRLLIGEIDGYHLEKRFICKSGKAIPTLLVVRGIRKKNGEIDYVTAMVQDISERKTAEKAIETLAYFDTLTQLPNRRLLIDRLHSALLSSARNHLFGAVLFIDMDKFKTLNDTLGHNYGDLMLIQVAQRILNCVREVDTVARFGGDEFLVLLEDVDESARITSQKVSLIAEKIRAALAEPYQLKEAVYISSPSIGISVYCGIDESADTLADSTLKCNFCK